MLYKDDNNQIQWIRDTEQTKQVGTLYLICYYTLDYLFNFKSDLRLDELDTNTLVEFSSYVKGKLLTHLLNLPEYIRDSAYDSIWASQVLADYDNLTKLLELGTKAKETYQQYYCKEGEFIIDGQVIDQRQIDTINHMLLAFRLCLFLIPHFIANFLPNIHEQSWNKLARIFGFTEEQLDPVTETTVKTILRYLLMYLKFKGTRFTIDKTLPGYRYAELFITKRLDSEPVLKGVLFADKALSGIVKTYNESELQELINERYQHLWKVDLDTLKKLDFVILPTPFIALFSDLSLQAVKVITDLASRAAYIRYHGRSYDPDSVLALPVYNELVGQVVPLGDHLIILTVLITTLAIKSLFGNIEINWFYEHIVPEGYEQVKEYAGVDFDFDMETFALFRNLVYNVDNTDFTRQRISTDHMTIRDLLERFRKFGAIAAPTAVLIDMLKNLYETFEPQYQLALHQDTTSLFGRVSREFNHFINLLFDRNINLLNIEFYNLLMYMTSSSSLAMDILSLIFAIVAPFWVKPLELVRVIKIENTVENLVPTDDHRKTHGYRWTPILNFWYIRCVMNSFLNNIIEFQDGTSVTLGNVMYEEDIDWVALDTTWFSTIDTLKYYYLSKPLAEFDRFWKAAIIAASDDLPNWYGLTELFTASGSDKAVFIASQDQVYTWYQYSEFFRQYEIEFVADNPAYPNIYSLDELLYWVVQTQAHKRYCADPYKVYGVHKLYYHNPDKLWQYTLFRPFRQTLTNDPNGNYVCIPDLSRIPDDSFVPRINTLLQDASLDYNNGLIEIPRFPVYARYYYGTDWLNQVGLNITDIPLTWFDLCDLEKRTQGSIRPFISDLLAWFITRKIDEPLELKDKLNVKNKRKLYSGLFARRIHCLSYELTDLTFLDAQLYHVLFGDEYLYRYYGYYVDPNCVTQFCRLLDLPCYPSLAQFLQNAGAVFSVSTYGNRYWKAPTVNDIVENLYTVDVCLWWLECAKNYWRLDVDTIDIHGNIQIGMPYPDYECFYPLFRRFAFPENAVDYDTADRYYEADTIYNNLLPNIYNAEDIVYEYPYTTYGSIRCLISDFINIHGTITPESTYDYYDEKIQRIIEIAHRSGLFTARFGQCLGPVTEYVDRLIYGILFDHYPFDYIQIDMSTHTCTLPMESVLIRQWDGLITLTSQFENVYKANICSLWECLAKLYYYLSIDELKVYGVHFTDSSTIELKAEQVEKQGDKLTYSPVELEDETKQIGVASTAYSGLFLERYKCVNDRFVTTPITDRAFYEFLFGDPYRNKFFKPLSDIIDTLCQMFEVESDRYICSPYLQTFLQHATTYLTETNIGYRYYERVDVQEFLDNVYQSTFLESWIKCAASYWYLDTADYTYKHGYRDIANYYDTYCEPTELREIQNLQGEVYFPPIYYGADTFFTGLLPNVYNPLEPLQSYEKLTTGSIRCFVKDSLDTVDATVTPETPLDLDENVQVNDTIRQRSGLFMDRFIRKCSLLSVPVDYLDDAIYAFMFNTGLYVDLMTIDENGECIVFDTVSQDRVYEADTVGVGLVENLYNTDICSAWQCLIDAYKTMDMLDELDIHGYIKFNELHRIELDAKTHGTYIGHKDTTRIEDNFERVESTITPESILWLDRYITTWNPLIQQFARHYMANTLAVSHTYEVLYIDTTDELYDNVYNVVDEFSVDGVDFVNSETLITLFFKARDILLQDWVNFLWTLYAYPDRKSSAQDSLQVNVEKPVLNDVDIRTNIDDLLPPPHGYRTIDEIHRIDDRLNKLTQATVTSIAFGQDTVVFNLANDTLQQLATKLYQANIVLSESTVYTCDKQLSSTGFRFEDEVFVIKHTS